VAAIDDPTPEPPLGLDVLVEVDLGGVVVEPGREHVLGLLDRHAVDVVDPLADLVVVPQIGAAAEGRVVVPPAQIPRHFQVTDGDRRGQLRQHRLGRRGGLVALADHDPADIVEHGRAVLVGPDRVHIDDAGLAVSVGLEPMTSDRADKVSPG
jgi:hypothetical protein